MMWLHALLVSLLVSDRINVPINVDGRIHTLALSLGDDVALRAAEFAAAHRLPAEAQSVIQQELVKQLGRQQSSSIREHWSACVGPRHPENGVARP